MGRSIFIHLFVYQALGLAVVAWAVADADSKGDRAPAGLARIEARDQARVDIRGALTCPMPAENTGRSCNLEIVNSTSGHRLKIIGSDAAMRLFQEGKTQVVASGTVLGNSIRIVEIRAR